MLRTLCSTVARLAPLMGLSVLAGCPVAAEFEPGPPEIGVVGFGIPDGGTVTVGIALDGADAETFDVVSNGVSVVVAEAVSEGVAWSIAVDAAPADTTCTLSDNATGTMGTGNIYIDLVCGHSDEVCNGLDDDGDDEVDEGLDSDGDGVNPCGPDGITGTADDDCDDTDASVLPGAVEVCGNDTDDDCDAATPDLVDSDGDGTDCSLDCDDEDPTLHGAAPELCNGLDDDCDGQPAPGEGEDLDGDGLDDACDSLPDLPCDPFTVSDVRAVADSLEGAFCLDRASGDALPLFLSETGIVEFSGLVKEWGPSAFEIAGTGVVEFEDVVDFIAGIGCTEEFGNGECTDAGRDILPLEIFATPEQQLACEEVAIAGCASSSPLVL